MGPARGKASPALGAPSPPRSLSSPQTRACLLLSAPESLGEAARRHSVCAPWARPPEPGPRFHYGLSVPCITSLHLCASVHSSLKWGDKDTMLAHQGCKARMGSSHPERTNCPPGAGSEVWVRATGKPLAFRPPTASGTVWPLFPGGPQAFPPHLTAQLPRRLDAFMEGPPTARAPEGPWTPPLQPLPFRSGLGAGARLVVTWLSVWINSLQGWAALCSYASPQGPRTGLAPVSFPFLGSSDASQAPARPRPEVLLGHPLFSMDPSPAFPDPVSLFPQAPLAAHGFSWLRLRSGVTRLARPPSRSHTGQGGSMCVQRGGRVPCGTGLLGPSQPPPRFPKTHFLSDTRYCLEKAGYRTEPALTAQARPREQAQGPSLAFPRDLLWTHSPQGMSPHGPPSPYSCSLAGTCGEGRRHQTVATEQLPVSRDGGQSLWGPTHWVWPWLPRTGSALGEVPKPV